MKICTLHVHDVYQEFGVEFGLDHSTIFRVYIRTNLTRGDYTIFPEICIFFCTCHNFPPPFFCANNYYTSLLLIVCALRWYIKSPHRHLFLVDISKHARVTHFLICGKDNSKEPWPTRPQFGLRVAKALSCDTDESEFFSDEPPPPSYSVEKRRDHRNLPYAHTKNCVGVRLVSITAKCFSYPQTKLGARRSRRLWVIFATN